MSLEITGKVLDPGQTIQVSEKFKKREFVLELVEEINGSLYTNYAKMQLVQTKCDIMDRFKLGDMVTVKFNIKGNSFVDKKDGSTKYITNLDVWRVEAAGGQQQQNYQQPPQGQSHYAGPPPAQQYATSPVTQGGWNAPAATQSFNPGTIDDLPF